MCKAAAQKSSVQPPLLFLRRQVYKLCYTRSEVPSSLPCRVFGTQNTLQCTPRSSALIAQAGAKLQPDCTSSEHHSYRQFDYKKAQIKQHHLLPNKPSKPNKQKSRENPKGYSMTTTTYISASAAQPVQYFLKINFQYVKLSERKDLREKGSSCLHCNSNTQKEQMFTYG